jgi:hypothetical protein
MAAMNEYQNQLVKDGVYDIPDVYSIDDDTISEWYSCAVNLPCTVKSPVNEPDPETAMSPAAVNRDARIVFLLLAIMLLPI